MEACYRDCDVRAHQARTFYDNTRPRTRYRNTKQQELDILRFEAALAEQLRWCYGICREAELRYPPPDHTHLNNALGPYLIGIATALIFWILFLAFLSLVLR